MNWLKFNHVLINCFDKYVMFPEFKESEYLMFMYANQVEESLKDDARVFMMFASLNHEGKVVISDIPVVCNIL